MRGCVRRGAVIVIFISSRMVGVADRDGVVIWVRPAPEAVVDEITSHLKLI